MGYFCRAVGCGVEAPGGEEVWLDRHGAVLPASWAGLRPADPAPYHPLCAGARSASSAPRRDARGPAPAEGPAAPAAPSSGLNLVPEARPPVGSLLGKRREGQGVLF